MAMILNNFALPLIFRYLDVENQHADRRAPQARRSTVLPDGGHRARRDVAARNLK